MPLKTTKREYPRVLVVVDNEPILASIRGVLESCELQITTAASVEEALHFIDVEFVDVLLSDWRMTEVGGGFTVVTALHDKNSNALTLVYTGYSELKQSLDAILRWSDEGWVRPMDLPAFSEQIYERTESHIFQQPKYLERVADIMEQEVFEILMDWLGKVEHAPGLIRVQLSMDDRIGQFPRLVWEVADRLRSRGKPVTRGLSEAALEQGRHRQSQGYSTEMISEEFRVLKLSIFGALYDRLNSEEFRLVLSNAHTINDECDRQLRQTLASFTRRMARTAA